MMTTFARLTVILDPNKSVQSIITFSFKTRLITNRGLSGISTFLLMTFSSLKSRNLHRNLISCNPTECNSTEKIFDQMISCPFVFLFLYVSKKMSEIFTISFILFPSTMKEKKVSYQLISVSIPLSSIIWFTKVIFLNMWNIGAFIFALFILNSWAPGKYFYSLDYKKGHMKKKRLCVCCLYVRIGIKKHRFMTQWLWSLMART